MRRSAASQREDPIGLSLDEDALELVGSRAGVGRPVLFQVGEPPGTLAGVLARRRLLDEAVLRELAQVERAARLARAELPGTRRSGGLAQRPEELDEVEAERMGEGPERARIGDLHKAKDSFDITRCQTTLWCFLSLQAPKAVTSRAISTTAGSAMQRIAESATTARKPGVKTRSGKATPATITHRAEGAAQPPEVERQAAGASRSRLARDPGQLDEPLLAVSGHPAKAVGEREQLLDALREEEKDRRRCEEQDRQHPLVRRVAVALEHDGEHDRGADGDERQPANEPDEAANQRAETSELICRDRDPRHPWDVSARSGLLAGCGVLRHAGDGEPGGAEPVADLAAQVTLPARVFGEVGIRTRGSRLALPPLNTVWGPAATSGEHEPSSAARSSRPWLLAAATAETIRAAATP